MVCDGDVMVMVCDGDGDVVVCDGDGDGDVMVMWWYVDM